MSILEHISTSPRTKRQIAELAGISTREAESLIQEARLRGVPVISDGDGYRYAQTAAEVRDCADRLRNRAGNQFRTARALRRAAARMEQRETEQGELGLVA